MIKSFVSMSVPSRSNRIARVGLLNLSTSSTGGVVELKIIVEGSMEKQLFVWSSAYSAKSALRFHPQLPRARRQPTRVSAKVILTAQGVARRGGLKVLRSRSILIELCRHETMRG